MFKSSLFGVYIVHIRKDRNIKLVNLQFQLRKQHNIDIVGEEQEE